MSSTLLAKYKILHDPDGYNVYKVDADGKPTEKKNKTPYKSHSDALPYFRKLYQVEDDNETKGAQEQEGVTAPVTLTGSQLTLGSVHLEADSDNPRFLRFQDAVLARAEMNSNRDALDDTGIRELAASITGCPIDLEHDPSKNIGFYTAGRAADGALRVDGVIWRDRCDALGVDPADIESGAYKLSIEATAETAECSLCHVVHADASSYCMHLKAKAIYGAQRILAGLRAVGGAITRKPAGSDTSFSTIYMVASHQEDSMEGEATLATVVEKLVDIEAAISKREDVSPADKKRAEKEYGDVEYADEKNKKYPLDRDHIHAAWSYINMPKNAAKYSSEELATIKSRIRHAAKKFGMEISEDKPENKSESSTTDKELIMAADDEKKETPEEEKKESPDTEKKEKDSGMEGTTEVQADDYATMAKKVADMSNDMACAKTDLEAARTENADLKAEIATLKASLTEARSTLRAHKADSLKVRVLASQVMDESEFEANKDTLLDMPEIALNIMLRATKQESTESNRVVASEQAPDNGKVTIIL